MKITEVIAEADRLMPNQYSTEQKIQWLSRLDAMIFNEMIRTHACAPMEPPSYESEGDELLVEFPYGNDIYVYYLQAKIAAENFETAKYNQFMELYNDAYLRWASWFNARFMPRRAYPRFIW